MGQRNRRTLNRADQALPSTSMMYLKVSSSAKVKTSRYGSSAEMAAQVPSFSLHLPKVKATGSAMSSMARVRRDLLNGLVRQPDVRHAFIQHTLI